MGLTPENVEFFESLNFPDTITYLEELDNAYYAAIPCLPELVKVYGDPACDRFYSERDLYMKYQRRYIQDHKLDLPDMNDERFCFSRRS